MAHGGDRDRGKERFWRRTLRQWRRSGQTACDFCVEHGLAEASFYAWRRTIAERDQQAAAHTEGRVGNHHVAGRPRGGAQRGNGQPVFVPVRVAAAVAMAPLEIVLGQGRVVRVTPGFDAATLRQLLAVLEEEPSC